MSTKPRITLKSSGKRQFDTAFKLGIVRAVDNIKRSRKWGIQDLLASYNLTFAHVIYWRKQRDQGHFSTERAIAYSRQDTMIHG